MTSNFLTWFLVARKDLHVWWLVGFWQHSSVCNSKRHGRDYFSQQIHHCTPFFLGMFDPDEVQIQYLSRDAFLRP